MELIVIAIDSKITARKRKAEQKGKYTCDHSYNENKFKKLKKNEWPRKEPRLRKVQKGKNKQKQEKKLLTTKLNLCHMEYRDAAIS